MRIQFERHSLPFDVMSSFISAILNQYDISSLQVWQNAYQTHVYHGVIRGPPRILECCAALLAKWRIYMYVLRRNALEHSE